MGRVVFQDRLKVEEGFLQFFQVFKRVLVVLGVKVVLLGREINLQLEKVNLEVNQVVDREQRPSVFGPFKLSLAAELVELQMRVNDELAHRWCPKEVDVVERAFQEAISLQ